MYTATKVGTPQMNILPRKRKIVESSDGADAQDVAQDEEERALRSRAERDAVDRDQNVRVAVNELHALLHAPEARLDEAQHHLHHLADGARLARGLVALGLDVCDDRADELDDRDDKRAEGHRADVVLDGALERAHERLLDLRAIRQLAEVPRRGAARKDHLAEGGDELRHPEVAEEPEPRDVELLRGEGDRLGQAGDEDTLSHGANEERFRLDVAPM